MTLFDDIVRFLKNKAETASRSVKNINNALLPRFIENPKSKEEIKEKLPIDLVYEFLAQLEIMKRACAGDENSLVLNTIQMLDEEANNIVEGTIKFDKDHPFYGFAPFHEKLLQAYIEREEYEKCSEIQKAKLQHGSCNYRSSKKQK